MPNTDLNTYVKVELYNEPNRITLYAIDMTCEFQDCVQVFLSEADMEYWLANRMALLKPYGIELKYNTDKQVRMRILDMYETAKVLKIERGKVWIG